MSAPQHATATLTFTSDKAEYEIGESAVLSWSSTDTKRCQASGDWSGRVETTGSYRTPPLDGSKTFSLKCNSQGGGVERTINLAVAAAGVTEPEPTLTLGAAESSVVSGGSTTLTWSASGVDSCSASGGWSGTRPVTGSESVGPITAATTYTLTCTGAGGTVVEMLSIGAISETTISWQAPTENTDGTSLTDLAGYRLYYGQNSGAYTDAIEISDPGAVSYALSLQSGTYVIAMTAVDTQGNESAHSNEITRTVP